jgi:prenyl protein peptidase
MLDRFLMALTAASTVGDDGGGGGNRQGMVAIAGCAAMAVLYVGSLYVPSVVLRLPPPRSINAHYLRRFLWSIVASALAAVACLSLLPVKGRQSLNLNYLLSVFGLCTNHLVCVPALEN